MTVRRTPKRLALNRVDRIRNLTAKPHHSGAAMPTLYIRYKINPNKLSAFEEYARNWPKPIERCGGKLIGYFLPTKLAGPTDSALALIDFPSLAAYEEYRRRLMEDPEARQNVAHAERSGCILVEDRSFLQWVEPHGAS
jgi:hypothetical protein